MAVGVTSGGVLREGMGRAPAGHSGGGGRGADEAYGTLRSMKFRGLLACLLDGGARAFGSHWRARRASGTSGSKQHMSELHATRVNLGISFVAPSPGRGMGREDRMQMTRAMMPVSLVLQAGCATVAGSGARAPDQVTAFAGCHHFQFRPVEAPGLYGMPLVLAMLEARRIRTLLRRDRWYAATTDEEVPNSRSNRGHRLPVENGRRLQIGWGGDHQSITLESLLAAIPASGESVNGTARSYSDDRVMSITVPIVLNRVLCWPMGERAARAPGVNLEAMIAPGITTPSRLHPRRA